MSKIITLNSTERSVLNLLNSNSRLSFSQIGLKINKSQQLVSSIVQKLMDKKIIENYYTLIDYSKFGVLNFHVYFKLSYLDKNQVEKFINYLSNHPQVSWLAKCGEKFDLVCGFYAYNPSQFNKYLKQIIMKFSKIIKDYSLLTIIVMRMFNSNVPSNMNTGSQIAILGGDTKRIDLKNLDLSILNLISENARISSVDMGKKLNVTPKTIISHIKKLETKKIICGYTTQTDTKKLNESSIISLVKYHNTFVKLEEKFIDFLTIQPVVRGITKTLGEWDLEITFNIANKDQFRNMELEIKERFARLIYDIQNITIYEKRKINIFPKMITKNDSIKTSKNIKLSRKIKPILVRSKVK